MDQRELSEFEHHRLEHPDVSWVDPDDDLADERARNDWHGLNKTAQLPSDTKMGRCRARMPEHVWTNSRLTLSA
jgi:hypothetical protein